MLYCGAGFLRLYYFMVFEISYWHLLFVKVRQFILGTQMMLCDDNKRLMLGILLSLLVGCMVVITYFKGSF